MKAKNKLALDNCSIQKPPKNGKIWNPYFTWSNGLWAYTVLNVIYPYIDF